MATNTDILSQLSAFSWTSGSKVRVEFPVTEMTVSFSQDLVEHKFWQVDGAQVEATGRNPLVFDAKIPFKNHIVPGKNEKFSNLYPSEYRKFILATTDRTDGTLVHPEFGPITCKVQSVSSDWRATSRDGCDVHVTWIETLTEEGLSKVNSNASPVNNVETFAGDLDAELSSTFFPSDPVYQPNFFDTLTQITSITDQVSIQSNRIVGKIDNVSYRLNRIEESVSRATTPPRTSVKSIINPNPGQANKALTTLYWPIRQTINQLKSNMNGLKQALLESGRPIVFFRVPKVSTIGSITVATKAPLKDLIDLNPDLVKRPYLPVGTIVRYYSSKKS